MADQSHGGGRFGNHGTGEPRPHPGDDRNSGTPHRTGGDQRRRHGRVGPVEQPGDRQGGDDMGGRHGRGGVMPGVSVSLRHGHMAVRRVPALGMIRAARPGQYEMQRALRRECATRDDGQRVMAAGDGPYDDELRDGEGDHEPPRHRALGDRVVTEGGEHAAHECEHPGSDAGSRAARPGARAPAVVVRHVITWHGRPSSTPGPSSVRPGRGSVRRAGGISALPHVV